MSIWKQNYKIMKELGRLITSYLTFVECGGHAGAYTDELIDLTIALLTKVKCNRDYINSCLNYDIPSEIEECETAERILDGTYQQERLFNVIDRMYERSIDA